MIPDAFQNDGRHPSAFISGVNTQLASHNTSILQSQQLANTQGHAVNQSMMSYKTNYSNNAPGPGMHL